MIKVFLYVVFFTIVSFASLVDNINLLKAQESYKSSKYIDSLRYYNKVVNKTGKVYYNIGNISYKLKRYDEAIRVYKKIKDKKLRYKVYHNLGNCYFKLFKLNKASFYYKKALDIKYDKDTKYNLQIVQDILTSYKQARSDKVVDKTYNKKGDKNKQNKPQKDSKSRKEEIATNNKKVKKEDLKYTSIKTSDKKRYFINDLDDINKTSKIGLSTMEEGSWSKVLKDRGIKTLMIPLRIEGKKYEDDNSSW